MSANAEDVTADQFKSLIGPPPLMRGESTEEYWTWWSAFVEGHQPKAISDWFEINELALKRWEERRVRRCASARVDSVLKRVLADLLRPLHKDGIPDALALRYYSDDEERKEEARETVEGYGITDDQIRAAAMEKCGTELLIFDRMENYRTSASRALRKDIDRRALIRATAQTSSTNSDGSQ